MTNINNYDDFCFELNKKCRKQDMGEGFRDDCEILNCQRFGLSQNMANNYLQEYLADNYESYKHLNLISQQAIICFEI